MKQTLQPGISRTARIDIDRDRTIDFMGDECRVYSTPDLVRDIEMTARDLLLEHSDPGEDSVGTRVAIDHLAATLLGMWVEIEVTVTGVKGRMVELEVGARDALDQVARGSHNRFVVDVTTTAGRLRAKAEKAAGAE
ncbi:MAG TPA: LysR family transcriptional regulator [Sedimenticola thiotaurini]|uniref:LysR family transcriptional regulator n=1 Tax=Sedimenticola thiotaurini TaxID=1543721 RepID=A0A831RN31_9GAMM|nr:LysR family transcriptional regulator [Sedimenticola thiotaurini]